MGGLTDAPQRVCGPQLVAQYPRQREGRVREVLRAPVLALRQGQRRQLLEGRDLAELVAMPAVQGQALLQRLAPVRGIAQGVPEVIEAPTDLEGRGHRAARQAPG